jgi:hypothetical protein
MSVDAEERSDVETMRDYLIKSLDGGDRLTYMAVGEDALAIVDPETGDTFLVVVHEADIVASDT